MPSKKKSKPSFSVPEALEKAPQSGWVYRSDKLAPQSADSSPLQQPTAPKGIAGEKTAAAAPPLAPKTPAPDPDRSSLDAGPRKSPAAKPFGSWPDSSSSILDLAVKTINSGFETMGNAFLLTTKVLTAPITLGMRFLGFK